VIANLSKIGYGNAIHRSLPNLKLTGVNLIFEMPEPISYDGFAKTTKNGNCATVACESLKVILKNIYFFN
jgi:hypothetical protein